MKDGRFETTFEILQALADGKRIRECAYIEGIYVHATNYGIQYSNGHYTSCCFYKPVDWELYEEPKPKTIYYRRKWIERTDGARYTDLTWHKSKEAFDKEYSCYGKVSNDWEEWED